MSPQDGGHDTETLPIPEKTVEFTSNETLSNWNIPSNASPRKAKLPKLEPLDTLPQISVDEPDKEGPKDTNIISAGTEVGSATGTDCSDDYEIPPTPVLGTATEEEKVKFLLANIERQKSSAAELNQENLDLLPTGPSPTSPSATLSDPSNQTKLPNFETIASSLRSSFNAIKKSISVDNESNDIDWNFWGKVRLNYLF